MIFTEIPTEQTTAVTDGLLAIISVWCCVYTRGLDRLSGKWRAQIWAGVFFILALASILGTAAHGLTIAESTRRLLWHPLNLALGLSIALFVTGVVYDGWGLAAAGRVLWPMLAAGVAFFVMATLNSETFLVFVIFQALALLFGLSVYGWLGQKGKLNGAWLMTAGILTTFGAGLIQASNISFTLIWPFNHNGVYHLVQMPALIVLAAGIRAGCGRREANLRWHIIKQ